MAIIYPSSSWALEEETEGGWICTAHSSYMRNLYSSGMLKKGLMYQKEGAKHRDIVEANAMMSGFCNDIYRKHAFSMKLETSEESNLKSLKTVCRYNFQSPYRLIFTNFNEPKSIRLDDDKLQRFLTRVHFLKSLEPLARYSLNSDDFGPYQDAPMSGHHIMKDLKLKNQHRATNHSRLVRIVIYAQSMPMI